MISFVRKKFVQNMMKLVECVCKKIVVHVSSQLRRRAGIVAGVEAEPDSTSYRCFKTCLSAVLVKPTMPVMQTTTWK